MSIEVSDQGIAAVESGASPEAPGAAYVFPATFSQQRLWFLDQLFPGDAPYLIAWAIRMTGPLSVPCLAGALNEIVRRHESLRTTFSLVDNQVMQVVAASLSVPVPVTSLQDNPDAEEEALRIAFDESRQPISLATGPLIRARLLRLDEREHMLLLTLHHIVFDQWSRGILIRELSTLYGAGLEGMPSALPALKLQYADFAVWQRRHLQGEVLRDRLSYWTRQLAGIQAEITLPTDRPRRAKATFAGALAPFRFSPELSNKIRQFSSANGLTLFMTLLTGFQALLARYSGHNDVVVGTPVSNRSTVDLENIIGFFTNTLALRLDLSGDPTFAEMVLRTKSATVDAYKNQDLPFERLVQEINPERSLSHNPLFQTLFSMGNVPVQTFRLQGLECRFTGRSEVTSKFDLSVYVRQDSSGLQGAFEYSTDLFDQSTVERMAGHYKVLLEAAVTDPGIRLSGLPLLTEAERRQLVSWNATRREYGREDTLPDVIERQVELTPGAPAVVHGNHVLTYRELNARANQLARCLQRRGAGPDIPVGICTDRSPDMLVGLLAILKSGSAYVPLDPDHPSERLGQIVAESGIRLLLTYERLLPNLPAFEAQAVLLDSGAAEIEKESRDNLPRVSTADNLAYVLFTSGSTGKPKGVQIVHRNLVNFLASMRDEPGIGPGDTLLAITTLSFDIAGLELYLPLTAGARIVIASREQSRDGTQLLDLLRTSKPSILQATPATWSMLLNLGWKGDPGLKALCGGEALPPELANRLLPCCGELWNLYGPTETTIWSSLYRITEPALRTVSIGRPIANTTLYVLDGNLSAVPVGVQGELYIGGDGVARGYLNRPDLTAEKFIADPFCPGERLYRTGDFARFLPDGNIEYLGRTDFQVKIRGFRIELGDVESVLAQHEAVKECAIAVRENAVGKYLAGYVVIRDKAAFDQAEIRKFLSSRLPEYMVPATLVTLDSLPLTPNGKLDRKALPSSGPAPVQESEYVAPRNAIEEKLVSIWSEVLRLPQIGINDDFFEIGGHSLLAVELFAKIEREMGDRLPLGILFKSPTVAQVAAHMGESKWTAAETSIKPCRTGGSKPPIYAAHGIGGTVLTFRAIAKHLDPDRPIYCLEELELDRGWRTLEDLAALYAADIRKFQPCGPYHLVGSSFGGMVAFEIARQLELQNQEVGLVGLLDSANLGAGNLRSRRERFLNDCESIFRRIRVHLNRLPDRRVSEWPRFLAGRLIAVGRRCHGALWRVAYRSYKTVPSSARHSHSVNLKRVFELAGMDYMPKPLRGRLVLFRRQEQLSHSQRVRQHGWSGLSAKGLEIIEVPGNHNSMMAEPHVEVLAARMTEWLDRYETLEKQRQITGTDLELSSEEEETQPMTLTLELPHGIGASLPAQTKAQGLAVSEYLQRLVQTQADSSAARDLPADEWVRQFRAWSHDPGRRDLPVLPDEAVSRGAIYGDCGR